MNPKTDRESLLTVRERLALEARKRGAAGQANGSHKNGSHVKGVSAASNGVAKSKISGNGAKVHSNGKHTNGTYTNGLADAEGFSDAVQNGEEIRTESTAQGGAGRTKDTFRNSAPGNSTISAGKKPALNGHAKADLAKVHKGMNGRAARRMPLAYRELNVREHKAKRALDLFVGTFGMLVFLLMTPFIALGIKLSSKGPVFFTQKRTGKNGKIFTCYKFRTMITGEKGPDPETGVPDITVRGDDRIFTFGKFLRFTNLDELPQIINVFKGDMSLVGPRPYPVDECTYWNNMFDDFYYRYAVKPGITGFAQVKGYRGGTLDKELIRKRTDYDLIYVQRNSLLFDIKTIALTVTQMVNLRTNGH